MRQFYAQAMDRIRYQDCRADIPFALRSGFEFRTRHTGCIINASLVCKKNFTLSQRIFLSLCITSITKYAHESKTASRASGPHHDYISAAPDSRQRSRFGFSRVRWAKQLPPGVSAVGHRQAEAPTPLSSVKYTRTTISIPEHVLEIGQERAAQFRLSFSDYLARLVEEESKSRRKTLTILAEDPAHYQTSKPSGDAVGKLSRAAAKFNKTKKQAARKSSAA